MDFEYGAVGDRFFDLANFSVNCELTDAQDTELLNHYLGHGAWGEPQLARLKLYKVRPPRGMRVHTPLQSQGSWEAKGGHRLSRVSLVSSLPTPSPSLSLTRRPSPPPPTQVLSDLREGLWGFVQWGVSTTCSQDFYADYGHRHLRRFALHSAEEQFDVWVGRVAAAGEHAGEQPTAR